MDNGRGPRQAGSALTDDAVRPSSRTGGGFDALLRSRRMTRRFDTAPLDEAELSHVLDLARRAPSAGFSQGVHFLVVTGRALATFWDTTGANAHFASTQPGVLDAPVIVLPVGDPAAYTERYRRKDKAGHGLEDAAAWPVPYWLTDAAMAAQNLLLLAEDRGWGALLFGIFRNHDELLAVLGAPAGVQAVGAVALGHRAPDDRPSGSPLTTPRRPSTDVVHWQRWS